MRALRKAEVRFTISAPRSEGMWRALKGIPDSAWQEAEGMAGAEVAETTYAPQGWQAEPLRLVIRRVAHRAASLSADPRARRLRTIHPEQLPLALGGELDTVYGYSFIATDHPPERDAAWVEHHHRHRAQVEERLGEAKLGQALRHLPSGDMDANRVWLHAALTAMNIAAMTCDLCPAAGASGQLAPWRDPEREPPARRAAKALRRMLVCVPARVVRSGRRTALRLPEGFRYAETFTATYAAIWALSPP
jgi:hypothetical protein